MTALYVEPPRSKADKRGDDPDDAVRAEKVAEIQQRGVDGTEDDEARVTAQQDASRIGAGRGSPAGQLHQPVAEHHREHRVRPAVHKRDHEEVDHSLQAVWRTVDAGLAREGEVRRVGQRDEQQHRAAGKVGGECPLGTKHRPRGGSRDAGASVGVCHEPRLVRERAEVPGPGLCLRWWA
ncbi:hypothetical protein ACH4VM_38300 [Streptomyces sp. NPDC020792]|uniref:hypothetical protein n=1 Tax=Streptomyces sp. NPDC020792 TaxID=3365089 RepID=UPI0037919CFA